MYLTMQLLVEFVYMFKNFVIVYQQKNEMLPFTHVIVSPLPVTVCGFLSPAQLKF